MVEVKRRETKRTRRHWMHYRSSTGSEVCCQPAKPIRLPRSARPFAPRPDQALCAAIYGAPASGPAAITCVMPHPTVLGTQLLLSPASTQLRRISVASNSKSIDLPVEPSGNASRFLMPLIYETCEDEQENLASERHCHHRSRVRHQVQGPSYAPRASRQPCWMLPLADWFLPSRLCPCQDWPKMAQYGDQTLTPNPVPTPPTKLSFKISFKISTSIELTI